MMAFCEQNTSEGCLNQAGEKDHKVFPVNEPSSMMHSVLETRNLWQQFDELGTEMIVTRRGRRMFPPIKVELHNLNPSSFYVLLMDLVPVDKYRYKYQNSKWVKCFEEACAPTRLYLHPESPALGSYWMDHVVSFYKLKLTNNQLDKQGHIIVNSMHRYQPRLHIVESSDVHNLNWDDFRTIIFPGTDFTTVTAYQNDKITQLKIENNPFAKGFRHPMSRIRMRPIKNLPRLSSDRSSDDLNDSPISYHAAMMPSMEKMNHLGLKRKCSTSGDELPVVKKSLCLPLNEQIGPLQVTTQENPAMLKSLRCNNPLQNESQVFVVCPNGIKHQPNRSPPSPVQTSNPQQTVTTHVSPINCKSTNPTFIATNGHTLSGTFQIVQLNPSLVTSSSQDSEMPTSDIITNGHSVEGVSSSSSDTSSSDSEDSETESNLTQAISPPVSLSNFFGAPNDKNQRETTNHNHIIGNSTSSPIYLNTQSSLMSSARTTSNSVLTLPQQPVIIQTPSLIGTGRSNQPILLPFTALPHDKSTTVAGPRNVYLQTCPIVGTGSSQMLQLVTLSGDNASSRLIQNTVPTYINGLGSSNQLPVQIITLAGTPQIAVSSTHL